MTNQSILDHLQEFLTPRRKELFDKVLKERTNYITVVAQDVHQLHNTSAVLRSCDVFGIQNIHIIEEKLPNRIDKEIAMGAQKWINVNRHTSSEDCIKELRAKGYKIVATCPHKNSHLLDDFIIDSPSAIFFGTERDGLSEEILEEADEIIKIPMVGFTESLNISVSAAIILENITTKLKKSAIKWQLTPEEKNELRLKWTKKTIKNADEIIERFLDS